jgi:hypothetical protein
MSESMSLIMKEVRHQHFRSPGQQRSKLSINNERCQAQKYPQTTTYNFRAISPQFLLSPVTEIVGKAQSGALSEIQSETLSKLQSNTLNEGQIATFNKFKSHIKNLVRSHSNLSNMGTTIDQRTAGRVGSPVLPVLPVCTLPVQNLNEKLPGWATHLQHMKRILDQNDITEAYGRSIRIRYRLHSDSESHDKHITILIEAIYREESNVTWPKAVRQIREYLNQAHVNFKVELIASALELDLQSFPFATDIYGWNKSLMLAVCDLVHGRDWLSLHLVYRGDLADPDKKVPTIVIGARDADEQPWWDEILPKIRLLPQVEHFSIQVELRHQLQYLTASAHETFLEQSLRYPSLQMGASWGTNTNSAGTFGGPMLLRNPVTSTELKLGISNHHVLAHHLGGAGPFTKFEPPIKVQSPSDKDYKAYVEVLDGQITAQTEQIDYRPSEKDALEKELDEMKLQLANKKSFNRHVGEVYASSGYRSALKNDIDGTQIADPWALDWSLTTIEQRATHTAVQSPDSNNWMHVTEYCKIDPNQGYRVFKKGRTSGVTAGFISATQAMMRVIAPEPENGSTAPARTLQAYPGHQVRCHVLIPDLAGRKMDEFIQFGDSGSLVLLDPKNFALKVENKDRTPIHLPTQEPTSADWEAPWNDSNLSVSTEPKRDGEQKSEKSLTDPEAKKGKGQQHALIAGLAFGGHDYALLSYMMPMDLVINDIERVTHLKVIEPKAYGLVRRDDTTPST